MRPILAHGFGQGYDLPLPLWLYLYGAAAAVVLSFVPLAVLSGKGREPGDANRYPTLDLSGVRAPAAGLRLLSVATFGLVVVAGLFGEQGGDNIAPTFVWVVWWVGFAAFTALVGNLWPLLNPWRILFDWAEWSSRRLGRVGGLWLGWRYPDFLGVWPATALYLAFIWFENVSADPGMPRNVALAILAYSLVTFYGMASFGAETWLRRGEAFSVFFGLLGRFAPTEVTREGTGYRLNLRPPAVGLAASGRVPSGGVAFVVLVLAGVTYDGLLETPLWVEVVRLTPVGQTTGLALVWALFLAVFFGFVELGVVLGRESGGLRRSAAAYAPSLVPIAVAYQLAHYLTFLIFQGPTMVSHVSDPMGRGWDLFGTADFRPDYGIVGAAFVWYAQVGLIVAGHVVAVYLAHRISRGLQKGTGPTVLGQIPMLVLMVLYTVSSLWILAQPIVE